MPDVFLVVSIDCECDKGPAWRSRRPLAFDGIAEGIGARLQPLFEKFGAKPTYLLSPEVMRHAPSVERLASLGSRAELGTHLHGEYAEPNAFEPDVTRIFQRDYPREVEHEKLRTTTESFTRAFGKKPTSFRAGRFGIGSHTLGILAELGYLVDSSVTPFMRWSDRGTAFSFASAPTQPYVPDDAAPEKKGRSKILEVPITIRPRAANRIPAVGRFVEPRWLRPSRASASEMIRVAREEIAQSTARNPAAPVILNAMFHNVEVIPGASPYAATEGQARAILGRVETLLAFAKQEGIRSIGLSDARDVVTSASA